MRHTVLLFSSLALVASVGCASGGTSGSGATAEGAVTTPRLQGLLQSAGGGLSGEVAIAPTSRAGEFRANLVVRGSSAGQQHPWHVHTGSCNAHGPVVGSLIAYQVLQVRGDGNVDLTQTVRETLRPGQSYYVDIHASRSDMDRILACADLHPASP